VIAYLEPEAESLRFLPCDVEPARGRTRQTAKGKIAKGQNRKKAKPQKGGGSAAGG
jgi:hypothetical protein